MAELRPSRMPQGEFAELLRRNGFPACSKAAVSLAERPKETGVQFTPEARETAQRLLNSARRAEKRVNPNKTTVWLDDELREWVQTQAYLRDLPVGEFIRQIIRQAQKAFSVPRDPFTGDVITFDDGAQCAPLQTEKAASDAGTSEAAGDVERTDCHGPAGLAMTGTIPSTSDITTKQEENQE